MAKKTNPPPPYGGLLLLYKPQGPTSLDLVRQVKRLSGIKKIGHVGTLDPFADGLLPVALGRATNMVRYMDAYDKVYRVLICLGHTSVTGDLTGELRAGKVPTEPEMAAWLADGGAKLKEVIRTLTGKITQVTPAYSAAKIDGKPMYEYARQGIAVEGKTRDVTIYQADLVAAGKGRFEILELLPEALPGGEYFAGGFGQKGPDEVKSVPAPPFWLVCDIHCSKGTYIRTWAQDLGERLGTGAYAARLRRLRSGPFRFEEAITLEDLRAFLEAGGSLARLGENPLLRDASSARPDLAVLELDKRSATMILQGKRFRHPELPEEGALVRLFYDGAFLGIGRSEPGDQGPILVAERMFRSLENITG